MLHKSNYISVIKELFIFLLIAVTDNENPVKELNLIFLYDLIYSFIY